MQGKGGNSVQEVVATASDTSIGTPCYRNNKGSPLRCLNSIALRKKIVALQQWNKNIPKL